MTRILTRPRGQAAGRRMLAGALASLALLVVGLWLASAGGGAGASPAGHSAATSAVGCPAQFGSFSAGLWPPACWRPYGARSPFNRPIPPSPRLAPESRAIVGYIGSHRWSFPTDGGGFSLPAQGSRPVYWSKSSDPVVTVVCRPEHFTCKRMRLHMPAGAQPQEESDAHMTVIDQALGREFDLWKGGRPDHGRILAAAASGIPIGPGIGTGLGGQAEAADLGLAGGLIRAPELAAGRIEHALAMTVECVQRRDVWPAPSNGRGDAVCDGRGAGPHLGSLLQLKMSDAEIAASHAPAWQQAIMRAMAHYGLYVVDTNGAGNTELSLIKEDDLSFTSFGYEGQMSAFVDSQRGSGHLVGAPLDVSRLRVIDPCVPRGTC
jgi:hypothetical protein